MSCCSTTKQTSSSVVVIRYPQWDLKDNRTRSKLKNSVRRALGKEIKLLILDAEADIQFVEFKS